MLRMGFRPPAALCLAVTRGALAAAECCGAEVEVVARSSVEDRVQAKLLQSERTVRNVTCRDVEVKIRVTPDKNRTEELYDSSRETPKSQIGS